MSFIFQLPAEALLLLILVLGRQESKAWLILSQILTGVEVLCKVVLHAKFSQLPVSRDDRWCCLLVDVMSCGVWVPYPDNIGSIEHIFSRPVFIWRYSTFVNG